jgi:hypothetical protein
MIMVQALLIAGVEASQIRAYPLDERSVYSIRLSKGEPTTCVFPGPIKALVGANVSTASGDAPGILLSHEPGTEYFSLRALKDDATGALNVIHQGRLYALAFITGESADQAVVFLNEALAGGAHEPPTAEALRGLLERAKQLDRLQTLYPEMTARIDRAQPGNVTHYRAFNATVEEVVRFDPEDVLVLRVRLENTLDVPVPYDPSALAVRVGHEVYPAALADATDAIPPKTSTRIHLVVSGGPGRGRTNLSVRETFNVIVPHP